MPEIATQSCAADVATSTPSSPTCQSNTHNKAEEQSSSEPQKRVVLADRYKTKLCDKWIEKGKCPYDRKCMFAHGEHELRTYEMNVMDGLTTEENIRQFRRMQRADFQRFLARQEKMQFEKLHGGVGNSDGYIPPAQYYQGAPPPAPLPHPTGNASRSVRSSTPTGKNNSSSRNSETGSRPGTSEVHSATGSELGSSAAAPPQQQQQAPQQHTYQPQNTQQWVQQQQYQQQWNNQQQQQQQYTTNNNGHHNMNGSPQQQQQGQQYNGPQQMYPNQQQQQQQQQHQYDRYQQQYYQQQQNAMQNQQQYYQQQQQQNWNQYGANGYWQQQQQQQNGNNQYQQGQVYSSFQQPSSSSSYQHQPHEYQATAANNNSVRVRTPVRSAPASEGGDGVDMMAASMEDSGRPAGHVRRGSRGSSNGSGYRYDPYRSAAVDRQYLRHQRPVSAQE